MAIKNPSPLRYPGGKYKISKLIGLLISKVVNSDVTYVEPFAGGAGVALDLLLTNQVGDIIINDSDRAIYSFWRALLKEGAAFLDLLDKTPITIDEWKKQKMVYNSSSSYSLEYGFATFFLNRVNHSGILTAGPIGGVEQERWKLNARFNKDALAKKIIAIQAVKKNIRVYSKDIFVFLKSVLPRYEKNAFIYFDPPYYNRGRVLYQNYFTHNLHKMLCEVIRDSIKCPWVVSYDDVQEIREIYRGILSRRFLLNYSLANKGVGNEIMFFSEGLFPTEEEIQSIGMESLFKV